ncbi:MAG: 4Fe-4S binding protein [Proteobacteria bacterium]|nr:4Fe-4S binding protein [Pseudomonadota bacterium]MBU1581948.1 4Fe-4S binding protein [Pseudomonadota bacterium]MBU2453798.1 4Fe-4S binding protein [Pseudomonadota bacterium]MBU2627362.1 4Fe-4S binding protein [Pseudomonadota bacterium]
MMDAYLEGFINKYDNWLKGNLIAYSSKVIPIGESLDHTKHIIPSQQAVQILKDAQLITLAECICRGRYKNCDKPLEVCFVLNETGEKWIEKGLSRKVDINEAKTILKQANRAGLVHLTLYKPDHEVFALCSCCSCCCHDLQLVMKFGKAYILARSDYIAEDDPKKCIHCGKCAERCEFNARTYENMEMNYDPEHCYGCGLCITTCPENAIALNQK